MVERASLVVKSGMLSSVLRTGRASVSLFSAAPGCALRVQENAVKLFASAQTPQAPESRQESNSEASTDPFLTHLQQKTEKELFEILRKQQQQPSTHDDAEETSVSKLLARGTFVAALPRF